MNTKSMLQILLGEFRGNKRNDNSSREICPGDVVCVESGFFKRYGIWTGQNFILYGKNRFGRAIVHEKSFRDFMDGAECFVICEFPKEYGRPTLWEQPLKTGSIVMPQKQIWELMEMLWKTENYKLYSPEETINRARSKLGMGGYPTGEYFALWCKTGIAESHELNSLRKILDRIIAY